MPPHLRITPRSSAQFDVVVVGAGPAGLAAGSALAARGADYLVLEAGPRGAQRSRIDRHHLIHGVGGAGLYSDGKFSFFPSATRLWELRSDPLFAETWEWYAGFLASLGIVAPSAGAEGAATSQADSARGYKRYPAFYVDLPTRRAAIARLEAGLGERLQHYSRVVSLRPANDAVEIFVEGPSGISVVTGRNVIFAGGRFGPLALARMWPELPTVFRRYEVGVRLEQPAHEFLYRAHPDLDVKLIEAGDTEGEEWRTFCTCREGEVVLTQDDERLTYSGRADDLPGKHSNIGLNLRFSKPPTQPLQRELFELVNGYVAPFTVAAREYIDSSDVFLGASLDARFRQRLSELPREAVESAVVYGPCIEGVGHYPDINSQLKVNSHRVWVAGDATGLFRGLTPAFVSGHYAATSIWNRQADHRELPAFVKQSPASYMSTVFTAQSKTHFYCRDAICEYVLRQGLLPLNPFRVFDYFLGDRVDRDVIRRGNNQLISSANELWVFGAVSDGVLFEIVRARQLNKPVRFLSISTRSDEIRPVAVRDVRFEPEVHAAQIRREDLLLLLEDALPPATPDGGQLSLGFAAPDED